MWKWLSGTALVALFLFVIPVFLFVTHARSRAQVSGDSSAVEQDPTAEQEFVWADCNIPTTGPELVLPESVPYGFWFEILAHALNTNQDDPDVTARREELIKTHISEQKGTPFEFVRGMSEIDPKYALHETRLNEVDQAVVKGEVFSWWENYKRLEADENAAGAAGKVTELNQAKADLTMATVQSLQTTLSPNGAAQFKKFILGQCEAHYTIEQCQAIEAWQTPRLDVVEELVHKMDKGKLTASEKEELQQLGERALRECQYHPPNFQKRLEAAVAGLR